MKRMMRFVFGLCVAWLLAGDAIAANGSWTSMGNGTTGYWTNNANWSGGTYPGSGAGETALFTNNNTGSYTAILDKTLPNALSTITMGTNGSQGYPILIFTNAIAVTSTAVTVGYNSSNNTLSVMPSVNWNLGNSDITVGNGGTGNVLTVNGGTLISNRNFIVTAGNTATFSNGATLVFAGLTGAGNGGGIRVDSGGTLNLGGLGAASGITNLIGAGSGYPVTVSGGTMILMNATLLSQQGSGSADINIGRNQFWGSGVGNSMVQVLANGFWNVPSLRTFFIGQASSTNSLLINAGKVSIATSGNIGYGSGGSVFSNNVTVVNGGNFTINGLTVGNYNIGTSPTYWNSFNMGGVGNVSTGSVGALTIGSGAPSSYNTMTVTNAVLTSAATTVGASSSSNNTATVQAGGTWNSGALTVGGSSANNSVQILAGGVLDMAANAMTTAAGAGNVITNTGGVYQFSTATPTITPTAGAGSIALNNGKISFRAITTADVRCNQTNTLTNMLFSGQNAFRLNTATNATTGQAYTFMNNGTATNFVRLELLNSSM